MTSEREEGKRRGRSLEMVSYVGLGLFDRWRCIRRCVQVELGRRRCGAGVDAVLLCSVLCHVAHQRRNKRKKQQKTKKRLKTAGMKVELLGISLLVNICFYVSPNRLFFATSREL